MEVIFEGRGLAGRTVRVAHRRIGQQRAVVLEIESGCETQRVLLSGADALALGRSLVIRAHGLENDGYAQ
jgi:hypothetical protein